MRKVIPLVSAVLQRADQASMPARLAGTVTDVVTAMRPEHPLYVIWPDRLASVARRFVAAFPGEAMFAVKANPDRMVIQTLYRNGVRSFDAASIEEVRLVRKVAPKAKIYFMHPVKSAEAIREAYHRHGVRAFVLDCKEELYKILRETDLAVDLSLFVRLALPKNGTAAIDFSNKFGAAPEAAAELLALCRPVAATLGVCFHVGTQTMDPSVYGRAVEMTAAIVKQSGVKIDVLDIGGGFPVPYPGQEDVPSVDQCVHNLKQALHAAGLDHLPLLAEPGRALVAESGALVVRVEQRRGQRLYINDGTYGGLFDAGPVLGQCFPVEAIRGEGTLAAAPEAFSFAGPTCDSLDMMEGPFMLPADIATGDWIAIGQTGAYSQSLRTSFNGFGKTATVYLYDMPVPAAN